MPSLNPFSVLAKHRNFRLFWFGQTASLIGTWMQSMAQGWLALDLTNNAFLVGLVVAAGSLPVVLFSLHAGVLVDRYEKLRIVRVCQALLLFEASLLFVFTWTGHISIGWLLILATFQGMVSSVEIPARQSMIVELTGREDLPRAIALQSSGFNLARIVGPALAALVIAKFGIAWAFGFNALSYVAVLVSLYMVRLERWQPTRHLMSPIEGIRESLTYMRNTPQVAALMKLVTVYSILGVPYLTLMPVFARHRLGLDASGYGLLLACVGVGGLVGALGLAARAGPQAGSRTLRASSYSYATILIILSTVRDARLAYGLLLLAGIAMIVNGAVSNSMLQHSVPDALRGRLMAAYSFVVVGLAQTVGSFVAGAVARALGVQWAIALGAIIMLGYALYAFRQPGLAVRQTSPQQVIRPT
ncbi:MAG TPA: MFS transporter [Gemmatimonadaceae bacterium]|nr:MFS transporter [Gemmatimonadaceae bacterium]